MSVRLSGTILRPPDLFVNHMILFERKSLKKTASKQRPTIPATEVAPPAG